MYLLIFTNSNLEYQHVYLKTFGGQMIKVDHMNWLKVAFSFKTSALPVSISFQSRRLLCGEPGTKQEKREESSSILSRPLCTRAHFPCKGRVIGVAMTTHAIQSLCVCVCVDSVLTTPPCPPPLLNLQIKKKNLPCVR